MAQSLRDWASVLHRSLRGTPSRGATGPHEGDRRRTGIRSGTAPVTTPDRAGAFLYRAELAIRLNSQELAETSRSAVRALHLSDDERQSVADDLTETSKNILGH